MKAGIISDIHLDINQDYPVLEILSEQLLAAGCGGLIVAGDITSEASHTLTLLEQMHKRLPVPFWFVPGNHDMWDPDHKFADTWQIYDAYRALPCCLCGKSVPVGDTRLTGSLGWYDYSFGDAARFTRADFAAKTRFGRTWQDSLFVRWGREDEAVCRAMLDELRPHLAHTDGKKVCAVTHMLSIPEFTVDPADKDLWAYFNAFLGSAAFGQLFEAQHTDTVINGHVHYRYQREKNGVDYRCACLGYHTEWPTPEVHHEIAESLQFVEL